MMNNRGQAFSVFQLLIAAIVAVAILGVLFGVMSGIDTGVSGKAQDAIGNSLAAVRNGGQTLTQEFTLAEGDFVSSNDFEENGFEPGSVAFGLGDFDGMDELFEIDETDEGIPYLRYTGNIPKNVKASILCQATSERLEDILSVADPDNTVIEGGCYNGDRDYDDVQPCCAVVLKRA